METPLSLYSRVKFRHVQCFLAVAQLRSLQRAAEQLSITQPAVSKTLAELEKLVGMKLFERGRLGAELTSEGRLFAPYADHCLESLRSGIDKLVNAHADDAIVIRFGILPTVASVVLPAALTLFRTKWPTTHLQVVTGRNTELLERLAAAEISFAVGRLGEPSAMAGMSFEHLFREPLRAVVRSGHALLQSGALTEETLSDQLLIVAPQGTMIRQSTDSVLAALGVSPNVAKVESLSVSLNLALTLQNGAVWFAPDSLVQPQIEQGALVPLRLPFGGTDEPIGLLRRSDMELPAPVASLFDAIRSTGLACEQRRIMRA